MSAAKPVPVATSDTASGGAVSSSGRSGLTVMPPTATSGWRGRFGFSQIMVSVLEHVRSTGSKASRSGISRSDTELPAEPSSVALCRSLLAVQRAFVIELADVTTTEAGILQCAIWRARSMRELWHLRTAVFKVVAVRHDQVEADRRLARLNCYFPTRTAQPGRPGAHRAAPALKSTANPNGARP